jgi:hypothetical protein
MSQFYAPTPDQRRELEQLTEQVVSPAVYRRRFQVPGFLPKVKN